MARKPSSKSSTPLDARRRALAEKEEQIRQQQELARKKIDEVPRIKERMEKQRREELMQRSVGNPRRPAASRLHDTRFGFDANVGGNPAPARRRPMKAEKRQQRITFFGLFFGLVLLLLWVYSVWRW